MQQEAISSVMDELKELVSKLEHAFSGRLVSVVLYGSGATLFDAASSSAASSSQASSAQASSTHPREHDAHFSDLNVLCVLK